MSVPSRIELCEWNVLRASWNVDFQNLSFFRNAIALTFLTPIFLFEGTTCALTGVTYDRFLRDESWTDGSESYFGSFTRCTSLVSYTVRHHRRKPTFSLACSTLLRFGLVLPTSALAMAADDVFRTCEFGRLSFVQFF